MSDATAEPTAAQPAPQTPTERFVESYETGTGDFDEITGIAPEEGTGTGGASEPVAANSPQPAPASSISPSLLTRARDTGFDDDEIAGMQPAELERTVHRIEQQLLKSFRQSQRDRAITDTLNPNPQAPVDGPAPTAAAPQPPVEEADDFEGFDAEAYDPFIGKLVNMVRDLRKEVGDLKAMKTEYQADKKQRAEQTFSEACDQFFATREDVYGKGNFRSIKPGTREMMRRRATIEAASRYKGDSWAEKLAAADSTLWGQPTEAPAAPTADTSGRALPPRGDQGRFRRPDPLEQAAAEEFRAGAVARPTQRDDSELPPGREKAIRTASKLMNQRQQAVVNGTGDDANEEDFPG